MADASARDGTAREGGPPRAAGMPAAVAAGRRGTDAGACTAQPVWLSAGDEGVDNDQDSDTGTITKTRPKTKKPSLYKVLLLNDDYTPMEFVVHILEQFFNKNREEAMKIMLHVHQRGVGVCGVYTYEVAETKVTQVIDYSRQNQHPLQCTMEKE